MVYVVKVATLNNKLNVKGLLDHIWYHNLNMSVGVVGYDFDYDHGQWLCARDWFVKKKRKVFGLNTC